MGDAKKYPLLAAKLRQLRLLKNATQDEIAEGAGVGLKAYQSWEEGRSAPRPTAAGKLAKFFSIPVLQISALVLEKDEIADEEKSEDEINISEPAAKYEPAMSEQDKTIIDRLSRAVADGNEAAKIQAIANEKTANNIERMLYMLEGRPLSSSQSGGISVQQLTEELQIERETVMALQSFVFAKVAAHEGKTERQIYDEFLDNDVAALSGHRLQANNPRASKNEGRKSKAGQGVS